MKIPKFKNDKAEREFWANHDSTDYLNWKEAKRVGMPKLRPSLKTISIRLPQMMLDGFKTLANRKDIPYQSLMKMFLAERLDSELRR